MAALSVVVLDPWGQGGATLVVAGEDLSVGPLGRQGAVAAFDLAVPPWGQCGLMKIWRAPIEAQTSRSEYL